MSACLKCAVIDDPAAATVALEPVRSRLLSELAEPASAATLATRLGIARQKVNYHLRALESHRLVRVSKKRKWGGLTERLMVATAASYIVSPSAMGPVATDAERTRARGADRLSASYLIALAARTIREVGALLRRSEEVEKRLPTLSLDTEIRFRSAAATAPQWRIGQPSGCRRHDLGLDIDVDHLPPGVHPGVRAAGDHYPDPGQPQHGRERRFEGVLHRAQPRLGGPSGELRPVVSTVDPQAHGPILGRGGLVLGEEVPRAAMIT